MILENHAWLCTCGESFDEPEQFTSHSGRARWDSPGTDHKPLGYCDLDTQEQALSWNFKVWKGKWKDQLDKKHAAGELPFVVISDPGVGVDGSPTVATLEDEEEDDEAVEDNEGTEDEPEPQSKKGKRAPIAGMVKVQFRPKVFDMDDSVVHLYNLFLGSMRRAGIAYEPSIGEWLRDVAYQHYVEHPEIIDLSSLLSPAERESIAEAVIANQREVQHAQ